MAASRISVSQAKRGFEHHGDENYETIDANERCRADAQKTVADSGIYRFLHRDDDDMADVKFTLMDGKTTSAHRYALCRSPVFNAMFTGLMRPNIQEPIMIEDLDSDMFSEILRFLYYDCVRLSIDNVTGVLYAAKKYQMFEVIEKCGKYMQDRINVDTVCNILEQSMALDERELASRCVSFIEENAVQVLCSTGFMECKQSTICEILNHDLSSVNEIDIFLGCVEWAKMQRAATCECEEVSGPALRKTMAGILPLIRFPIMSLKEFADIVTPMDILSDKEGFDVFKYLTRTGDPRPEITQFSTEKRWHPVESFTFSDGFGLTDADFYKKVGTSWVQFQAEFEINTAATLLSLNFELNCDPTMRRRENGYIAYLCKVCISQDGQKLFLKPPLVSYDPHAVSVATALINRYSLTNKEPNFCSINFSSCDTERDGGRCLSSYLNFDKSNYHLSAGRFTIAYSVLTDVRKKFERIYSDRSVPTVCAELTFPNLVQKRYKRSDKYVTCMVTGVDQPLCSIHLKKFNCFSNVRSDDDPPSKRLCV